MSHDITQAVMRCIVGYFMDNSKEEIPYIKSPLHSVIKLTPAAYGKYLLECLSCQLKTTTPECYSPCDFELEGCGIYSCVGTLVTAYARGLLLASGASPHKR